MIQVRELFQVVQDIARKEQKGYFSDREFNRKLKVNELRLLGYFWGLYERDQEIVDHLAPFVVNDDLAVENARMLKPANYAHRIRVGSVEISNVCNGEPLVKTVTTHYIRAADVNEVANGAVTRPSIEDEQLYHYFEDDTVKFLPKQGIFKVNMTYLRYPVYGQFLQTTNVVGGEDVFTYDGVNSRNLEWPYITMPYIKALMLMSVGVEVEDPGVAQYGMSLFTTLERRDQ